MTTHSRSLQGWTVTLSLTLCALVAGMSYLIWKDTQHSENSQQRATDISSIRIQRTNFPEISITKKDGLWNIESPCSIPANDQRLSPLLGALKPGSHQYSTAEVDLIATGLATPMATVFLNEQEYRLGHTDVDGNRRYLQHDNSVYFVPEWVLSLVNGGVTALAQLELFASPLSGVKLVDGQIATIERSSLENPDIWQNLTAQQIATWPVDGAPATPTYSLSATSGNGRQQLIGVFETDRFTAIRLDEAECAYILERDALPD